MVMTSFTFVYLSPTFLIGHMRTNHVPFPHQHVERQRSRTFAIHQVPSCRSEQTLSVQTEPMTSRQHYPSAPHNSSVCVSILKKFKKKTFQRASDFPPRHLFTGYAAAVVIHRALTQTASWECDVNILRPLFICKPRLDRDLDVWERDSGRESSEGSRWRAAAQTDDWLRNGRFIINSLGRS